MAFCVGRWALLRSIGYDEGLSSGVFSHSVLPFYFLSVSVVPVLLVTTRSRVGRRWLYLVDSWCSGILRL